MTTNFNKVIEFNKTFGLAHYDTEQRNVFEENPKLANLRYSLIKEEIGELAEAFETHDFIEVIDALTDILYVVYGAASSFGFNINELYYNTDTSANSSKTIYENVLGKVPEFASMHIGQKTVKEEFYNLSLANHYLDKLQNLDANLFRMIQEKNYDETKTVLLSTLMNTYLLGCYLGIDLNRSFDIVHSSNMSKVCANEDEAKFTVQWYKDNEERYDSPDYRLCYDNTRYVVFNKSTGKILKNTKYVPANFDCMV